MTIDGREVGASGPRGYDVALDAHRVEIRKNDQRLEREVVVSAGRVETVRFRFATAKPVADMVRVPAGSFYMGCNERIDSECVAGEKPVRTIDVPEFRIDRTEVTVRAHGDCVRAGRCSADGVTMPYYGGKNQPKYAEYCNWGKGGREEHRMNCVDWYQARTYCAWPGQRWPSEAEWEKAARGTDGRKYPWGNGGYGSSGRVANIADESARRLYPGWTVASGYDDGWVGTAPVGSFPGGASPYGAQDMMGNVWEWVESEVGDGRGIRGGSWVSKPRNARASYRRWFVPRKRYYRVAFRCAQ